MTEFCGIYDIDVYVGTMVEHDGVQNNDLDNFHLAKFAAGTDLYDNGIGRI